MQWFIVVFLALFGAVFLSAGLFVRSNLIAQEGEVVVQGLVVDVGQSGGDSFAPLIEFTDPETGQRVTVTSQITSNRPATLGEEREVAFSPGNPADARVIGQVWFAWIFIAVGAVVLLVSGLALRGALRSRGAEAAQARVFTEQPGHGLGRLDQPYPQDDIRTDNSPQDELYPQDEVRAEDR